MRKNTAGWELDAGLLMENLERRVLRSMAARANWPTENVPTSAQRRAAELIGSHFRRTCREAGRSPAETEQTVKARVSDQRWIGRAHVALRIKQRYRTALSAFAAVFKLTADHPDASRRQFDAMDLIGACEDWRWWRPEGDLGLKYRGQVQQLGHARNKERLANALRVAARDLQRYRLALGLQTEHALARAGLRPDSRKVRALARDGYETAAVFDSWYFEFPLYASMLATALQELSKNVLEPPKLLEVRRGMPRPDMLRIGYILIGASKFPLPQMPRVGLAVNLVQLLAEMTDDTAGRGAHAKYNVDSSRQNIPSPHFRVVAAFVSAALEIYYSPAAATKAIQKFRARHPKFMLMNWPFQADDDADDEADESVQSLQ